MVSVSIQHARGNVRDAIVNALRASSRPLRITEIHAAVELQIGTTPQSSIRSYLNDLTSEIFARVGRGVYALKGTATDPKTIPPHMFEFCALGKARLYLGDC